MAISSGFGSRYGRKIRKKYDSITSKYKFRKQKCPFCGMERASRQASGIYECDYCNKKFAGGAYEVETRIGTTIKSSISKRDLKAIEEAVDQEIEEEEKKIVEKKPEKKAKKKVVEEKEESE